MGKTRDLLKKIKKPREYFMQRCAQKGKKWQGPNRNRGDEDEVEEYTENCAKKSS